jgi:hypothetical protein
MADAKVEAEFEAKVSPSTQLKVISTKHYLSEYYHGLFIYLEERKKR